MFNNQYPYTDFNEYNLDWIIRTVKDLTVEWAEYKTQMDADWLEMRTDWSTMKEDLEELKTFITTYFDNLDVQEEINHKIDQMAEDGSLLAIIKDTVESKTATTTTAWLTEHITEPEGVVIDDSLTVSGACADAKATGDAISDVKGALDQIIDKSTNRFNTDTLSNTKLITDGTETPSSYYKTTDYIPVTPEEIVYFWAKNADDLFNKMTWAYVVCYNSSKEVIAASSVENQTYSFTVPSNTYYIRLCTSNAVMSLWHDIYVGSLTIDDSYEFSNYDDVFLKNKTQIENNTRDITNITIPSTNKFNIEELIPFYLTTDNVLHYDILFRTTNFIPVNEGETIYGWGLDSNSYSIMRFRFVVAYDENKNVLTAKSSSDITSSYVVPSGVSFVRITLYASECLVYTKPYIGTHSLGVEYEPYGKVLNNTVDRTITYTISNGDSLLESVIQCYIDGVNKLIVEFGEYDLIEEYKLYYGNTYFSDYNGYSGSTNKFDRGVWLENIEVVFNPGAKVLCKYNDENPNVNVTASFSAFAIGNNVKISGLVLDAENLEYGIHADFNSGENNTYFTLKNCDIKHVNSGGNKCVGAGTGTHVTWTFEDCIFRTTGNYYAIRIHNNFSASSQSKIIVKDCYIDGSGYFLFTSYGSSQLQTIIQVCGCSYANEPVVQKETQQSEDNMTLIKWNNEIRTN